MRIVDDTEKEYTNRLMANVSALSTRNEALKAEDSALRQELLNLKNRVIRHVECSSAIIDECVARNAGCKLVEVALVHVLSRMDCGHSKSPDHCEKSPSRTTWRETI